MSELATLTQARPTVRDEDWRYADADWLAAADPAALNKWRELSVPAGETLCESASVAPGADRLRVHVGKGARFELFLINHDRPLCPRRSGSDAGSRRAFRIWRRDHWRRRRSGRSSSPGCSMPIPARPRNQVVRAVQWGQSIGNFLGRIEVARDAQKTDAAQNFRAILLEKGASANAKPELEIFADDVKCAHGAAIGALDEAAAFYMAARGLPPEAAKRLLVRAFIADAFEAVEDAELRDQLFEQAIAALDVDVL